MTRHMDLRDAGLPHEEARRINAILRDLTGDAVELRRIPENDPAFGIGDPPRRYGVWEHNVAAGQPNWVFTLPEMSLDHRIIARVLEGSVKNLGSGLISKVEAFEAAQKLTKQKRFAEQEEEREEEMLAIARLSQQKSTFTHTLNGEKFIIGDDVRPVRKHIIE